MTNLPHTDGKTLPHSGEGKCWCEPCVWDRLLYDDTEAVALLTAARIRWQEMAVEELTATPNCEPKLFPGGDPMEGSKPPPDGELKTCPFCGHRPKIFTEDGVRFPKVYCGHCGAEMLLHEWNSRPLEEAAAQREAELREKLVAADSSHAETFRKFAAAQEIVDRCRDCFGNMPPSVQKLLRAALETSR